MDTLDIPDGDITHRQEIVKLLKMAIAQKWEFSHVQPTRKKVISNLIGLLSVDHEVGIFRVSKKIRDLGVNLEGPIMFRLQSGGISALFTALLTEIPEGAEPNKSIPGISLQLPYKISCTQLRKSFRLNLEEGQEIPVTLYMTNGALLHGSVVDISNAGAKIVLPQSLGKEANTLQMIDACEITLSEDSKIQTGLQIMGMSADEETGATTLRCQFMYLKSEAEAEIDNFISETMQQEVTREPQVDTPEQHEDSSEQQDDTPAPQEVTPED